MSDHLELHSLGQFVILHNHEPITDLASSKAYALLVYLAIHRRPLSRAYLAELFWPNREAKRSLANLRVILSSIRQQLTPFVTITNQEVSFNVDQNIWFDVYELENQMTQARAQWHKTHTLTQEQVNQLIDIMALYTGSFLADFHVPDSPGFEKWVTEYRHHLEETIIDALDMIVNFHLRSGDYQSGIPFCKQLLQVNQLREETYRQLMLLYALSNNRGKAIEYYELCRQILQEQLGIEPNQKIIETYEQIIHGSIKEAIPEKQPKSLSSNLSNLIGRQKELEKIIREINDPDCRLLTLMGPGGIGKTRLALEIVQIYPFFTDGIYFVPLYSLNALEHLPQTIAKEIHFTFKDKGNAKELLINHLSARNILLILDNYDHLIEEGTAFISDLLAQTDSLKILITSRERLNLKQETVLEITPLDFPENVDEAFDEYSAIKLFVQKARVSQSDYVKPQMNRSAVLQICKTVAGNPLGIELAAAMTRYVSAREISKEIQRNLDFLASTRRDISGGHQSLRAVFEHSWKLLSGEEKNAFRRLSVFPGSFSREAATKITGTSFSVLSALVDKSLVRRNGNGRFQMHQLLRQYAQEKLSVSDEFPALKTKYCQFYSDFLGKREIRLTGSERLETLEEIKEEIENIRIAWRWMTELNLQNDAEKSLHSLWHFLEAQSWFTEALSLFHLAAEKFNTAEELTILSGRLLRCQGWFQFKTGELSQAKSLLKSSLDIANHYESKSDICFSLTLLGFFYNSIGEPETAKDFCKESLIVAQEINNEWSKAVSLNVLGNIARRMGDYSEAKQLCQESLRIAERNGDHTAEAICLNDLGQLAFLMSDYENANKLCQQSLILSKSVSDQLGVAISYARLGMIAQAKGDFDTARNLYDQSLRQSKSIDDRVGIALSLNRLSAILCFQGEYQLANEYCQDALQLSRQMKNKRGIIFSLNCSGRTAFLEKKLETSSSFFKESLQMSNATHNWHQAAIANIGLADISWLQKDISSFNSLAIKSIDLAKIAKVPYLLLDASLQIVRLLFINQELEKAFFLIRYIQNHPMSWAETRETAQSLNHELASSLHPDAIKRAQYEGEMQYLNTFINEFVVNFEPTSVPHLKS